MAKQKKQRFEGIVYSTDADFSYDVGEDSVPETLSNAQQKLKISLDKKARKGKMVTLIAGFIGTNEDLETLAKWVKQKCGVGGSAKDGEILIQGDFRQKVFDLLKAEGYNVKGIGF
ncbi:translation initiation factor [Sphingobacterium sp. Mn56C]|uniref:translation initiation factor n=1 Tax=Sphingobacterium sp. Mn56C TaxID=3395261 RepID=UPI003BBAD1CE